MRLGIGSYTYAWAIGVPGHLPPCPMTAQELLGRAHDSDVTVVQIADNLPLHHLESVEIEALSAQAREWGMTIEVGTRGIKSEHLLRYLNLAVTLNSPILRVVIDTAEHHPSPDEVVAILKPMMGEFERHQVTLAIENHDRFTADTFRSIIERLDTDYVGICLDTVNSFGALEGPEVVIRTLAPYVVNLHVKDFTIFRASHMMGFTIEGRPAGQGRLDVPLLLDQLRVSRFDFNAILELWTPPEVDLSQTIAKEAAWAESSIAYLRGVLPDHSKG